MQISLTLSNTRKCFKEKVKTETICYIQMWSEDLATLHIINIVIHDSSVILSVFSCGVVYYSVESHSNFSESVDEILQHHHSNESCKAISLRSVAILTLLSTRLNTVLNRLINSQHCKRHRRNRTREFHLHSLTIHTTSQPKTSF